LGRKIPPLPSLFQREGVLLLPFEKGEAGRGFKI